MSAALYSRFTFRTREMTIRSAEQLLSQATVDLEDYLVSMRRISDAMYYDVIKSRDLGKESVSNEMALLYEAHKDNLVSFALYNRAGNLISAAPVATQKENVDVTQQEWFLNAVAQEENLHFSLPHVQNLFDDSSFRYYWVISLSRAVDITDSGVPMLGVLLVDMNYSAMESMMARLNEIGSSQYFYLCDRNGELIYHPRLPQITSGNASENTAMAVTYEDGVHTERYDGVKRTVIVSTISYTGWKLVSVIPNSVYSIGMSNMRYFIIMVFLAMLLAIFVINRSISYRISRPLMELDDSIRRMEAGELDPEKVSIGGPEEVAHIGATLRDSFRRINALMDDIVIEQEEKRISELDALQSQINPHFLYNTLDSIVWMIEGGRNKDAVFMVTQLASLFRISLSKGKTIISIEDELRHAQYYMNIQKVRYKDSFEVSFDIDEEVKPFAIVKLVVQPILENAVYYGVEGMDGEGKISVRAYRKEDDIYIEISDNGIGIPEEEVPLLLTDNTRVRRRGSGVGLINVHKRLQLRFGEAYGLHIESMPDEGTTVTIHIPVVRLVEAEQ